jgi:hypothetical protein
MVDKSMTASGHEGTNVSPVHQHNLHLTYREILAKSSATARTQAFSQLIATLPEEDLEYIDSLVARDLCEALKRVDSIPPHRRGVLDTETELSALYPRNGQNPDRGSVFEPGYPTPNFSLRSPTTRGGAQEADLSLSLA